MTLESPFRYGVIQRILPEGPLKARVGGLRLALGRVPAFTYLARDRVYTLRLLTSPPGLKD